MPRRRAFDLLTRSFGERTAARKGDLARLDNGQGGNCEAVRVAPAQKGRKMKGGSILNMRYTPGAAVPAVTTSPLPSSRKVFATPDEAPELRVPLREIILSEGAGEPNLAVYDTSGPYTDPTVTIDVNAGLSRNRTAWVKERGGVEEYEGRTVKPVDNGNVSGDKAA